MGSSYQFKSTLVAIQGGQALTNLGQAEGCAGLGWGGWGWGGQAGAVVLHRQLEKQGTEKQGTDHGFRWLAGRVLPG